MLNKETINTWFQSLQDDICRQLEALDGQATFREDLWDRSAGGGGRTRVIQEGQVLAKGGVNFSAVHGPMTEKMFQVLHVSPRTPGEHTFYATGVSLVLHPNNPWVPIVHMNVRYFEVSDGLWWFGGGIDLTPHYVQDEDAQYFHQQMKSVCDAHDVNFYPKFKNWADDYFFIKHRNETRGVGGIFFDRMLDDSPGGKEKIWTFVQAVGNAFCNSYIPIAQRNKDKAYGERELAWQSLRRGRYVEFNLVWDRGTKFGLETDGRTESILMSLPPVANWVYDYQVEPGSLEAYTQEQLVKGKNWINTR